MQANTKPGKHLDYNHPAMKRVRDHVAMEISSDKIHEKLCANFDQVWCMNFRPRARSLQQKTSEYDPLSKLPSKKKLRQKFERILESTVADMPLGEQDAMVATPRLTGGAAANVPVEGYRKPHTLTTLSWCDGSVSRGFVTVNEDDMSESQRAAINKDWELAAVFRLCIYIYTHIFM
jgi:hypothetical protein